MTRALAPILSPSALPRPLAPSRASCAGCSPAAAAAGPTPALDLSDHLLRDIGLTRHDLGAFDRRAR
jgi:hypothetical protein